MTTLRDSKKKAPMIWHLAVPAELPDVDVEVGELASGMRMKMGHKRKLPIAIRNLKKEEDRRLKREHEKEAERGTRGGKRTETKKERKGERGGR
jgi:hypothetical protein